MGKFRRGNYIFLTSLSDHAPRHVHVYSKTGRLVVKWDLEHATPMKGRASARLRALLSELGREGKL